MTDRRNIPQSLGSWPADAEVCLLSEFIVWAQGKAAEAPAEYRDQVQISSDYDGELDLWFMRPETDAETAERIEATRQYEAARAAQAATATQDVPEMSHLRPRKSSTKIERIGDVPVRRGPYLDD